MGQLLITQMFSSQASTPSREPKAASPELGDDFESPYKNNHIDLPVDDIDFEEVDDAVFSTQTTPLKRQSRIEVHIAARSPLCNQISTPPPSSVSIPATPDDVLLSSQLPKTQVVEDKDEETSVPETPPHTSPLAAPVFVREESPSPDPRPVEPSIVTPNKPTSLTKGASPLDAIDISSGVDSDCEITLVRASPKKKQPQRKPSRSRNNDRKKANSVAPPNTPSTPSQRVDVAERSKSEPPKTRQPTSTPQTAPTVASTAVPTSAPSSFQGRAQPAVKGKSTKSSSQASEQDGSSRIDPAKRNIDQSYQTPTKKRRINARTPSTAPVAIPTAIIIEDDVDAPATFPRRKALKGTPSPKRPAQQSTPIINCDSDADGEDSEMDDTPSHVSNRKIIQPKSRKKGATPQITPGRRLFKAKTPVALAPNLSLTPSKKSPVIDLTSLVPSDESDVSSEEDNFVTRLMPSAKSPSKSPKSHRRRDSRSAPAEQLEEATEDRDASVKAMKRESSLASSDEGTFYDALPFPAGNKSPTNSEVTRDHAAKMVKQEHNPPSSPILPFHDSHTGETEFGSSPPSSPPSAQRHEDEDYAFNNTHSLKAYLDNESQQTEESTSLKMEVDSEMELSSPISYRSSSDEELVNFDIPAIQSGLRPSRETRAASVGLPNVLFESDPHGYPGSDEST